MTKTNNAHQPFNTAIAARANLTPASTSSAIFQQVVKPAMPRSLDITISLKYRR
jgi:hypothetical protein